MPNEMKNALERELVGLRWETKDSVASMRIFIEQAKGILTHYLQGSELLEKSLADLVDQRGALDAIILNNLPMDPLIPETPTDGSVTLNKPTFIAEAMLLAIGELAGTHAIGYSSEKHYSNPWVHEGFPRKGLVSALTATDQVPHHQDMSYQTIIPDLLGLFCLREGQDLNVQTTLLDPLTVVEQLSENIEATLRQSRFGI
jgi:L-asparagine oxygenase